MKNRIHLKKRKKYKLKMNKSKKINKKEKIFLILILLFISIIFCISIIGKKITPILMIYAEKKAKSIATVMITEAVNNNVFKDMNKEELFIQTKDKEGNIVSTDFNPIIVNTVLNKITIYVQNYLEQLESGGIEELELSSTILSSYDLEKLKKGIIYEIPSGIVFRNSLISNLGPKIPVKINLNGDVITDINTEVMSYGINNALIKVSVNVKVYMQVIIPFKTKEIVVEANIPVIMKLVEGNVPSYYYPYSNQNNN
ncbi:MAG: sporulation protein YunB [Bacilli bacterium]|nr:sporulation protein YunB [Bacilli bacterium]